MAKKAKKKVAKKKRGKQGGKPLIPIDWDLVDKYCIIQCTRTEIASLIGISDDQLNIRCKKENGITIQAYIKQKSVGGKMSLRRKQYEKATKAGSVPLLIWLGKQYLGQRDKLDVGNETDRPFNLVYQSDKKIEKRKKSDD